MFPLTISGEAVVPMPGSKDEEEIRRKLVAALESANVVDITHDGTRVKFRAPWPLTKWNPLVMIDSGDFEIHAGNPGRVTYNCSMRRMLVTATLLSLMIASLPLFAFPPNEAVATALTLATFYWLWLFGLSYLGCKARLSRFMSSTFT